MSSEKYSKKKACKDCTYFIRLSIDKKIGYLGIRGFCKYCKSVYEDSLVCDMFKAEDDEDEV